MHVALVAVPIMDYQDGVLVPIAQDETKNCPPYGVYLLSSCLKAAGHKVTIIDLIAEGTHDISRHVDALNDAALVGIGATSLSWPTAVAVVKQLRAKYEHHRIVVGGIHATMFDEYILSRFPIDFVLRGEAERTLPLLCSVLESGAPLSDVPNLTWKDDSGIHRNPMQEKISPDELLAFPFPDYDELPSGIYKGISIESSRGCARDCSFCSTSYRQSWRGGDVQQFVDRLERLLPYVPRTVCHSIHIVDDEFSTNPERATAIAREISMRGLQLGLVYDSRANDLLYDGFVDAIAPHTHQFLVGAECGYDEGLVRIGKGTTRAKIEAAAKKLYENGISERADFSFILGLPWEEYRDVERTIAFAAELVGTYSVRVLLQWYCQIPGSRLWEADREAGRVTEAMYDDFGFFRDHYLFRAGVKLTPEQIWDVAGTIRQLQYIAHLAYPTLDMIESAFPEPIATYYPLETLSRGRQYATGLGSLREVSRPPIKIGIPQRTVLPSKNT